MNNVEKKEYGTVERVESPAAAAPAARSRGRVAIGVLAVVCLVAYAISRKGGTTPQHSVGDFHKATKCTDQCSSYDHKGVAECEKHYQIQSVWGCGAKQYGCLDDPNGCDNPEAEFYTCCHGCKYDETWGTCSEKSSCDDSDAIKEDSNGVCNCELAYDHCGE